MDDLSGLPAFELFEPVEPDSLVTVEVENGRGGIWTLSGITSEALEQGELVVFHEGQVHRLPLNVKPSRYYWRTLH